jgi:hypothetical protein
MPTPSPERSLLELATARLRQLFTAHFDRMMANLRPSQIATKRVKPAAKPAAAEAEALASRCGVRGCVFPSVVDGLCRTHFMDSRAEKSVLPSTTGTAIINLECRIA